MLPSLLRDPLIKFLKHLEKYMGIDMVYLASGGSWLTLGQIISSLTVFGTAIAFAHLIPKETYGTYKYALSVVGILSVTTLPGVNTYMAQAIARGAEGTFMAGVRARLLWGFVGSAGSAIVALYYAWNGNISLAGAFVVAAIFIPFVETLGLYNTYLQSTRRFRESITYFAGVQIGSALCLIGAMAVSSNLLVLLLAYFLPPTLLRFFFLRSVLRRFPPNEHLDRSAVGYGAHLSAIGVLGQIVMYIDNILLFHILGPIQVAVYSFALAPTEQIRALFTKNLPSLALPKMAKRSFAEIDQVLVRRMIILASTAFMITIAYTIISPYFFRLLFPQYVDAARLSQVLAALIIITLPASLLGTALQAKLHTIPPSWLYWAIVPDTIHILALVVCLPIIGMWAVVVSKALESGSALAISFIQWQLLHRKHAILNHDSAAT